jgi:hypothetical protein
MTAAAMENDYDIDIEALLEAPFESLKVKLK